MRLECCEALIFKDRETPGSSNPSLCGETTGSSPRSDVSWPVEASSENEHTSSVFDEMFTEIPETSSPAPPIPMNQRAFPTSQLSGFAAVWDNGKPHVKN